MSALIRISGMGLQSESLLVGRIPFSDVDQREDLVQHVLHAPVTFRGDRQQRVPVHRDKLPLGDFDVGGCGEGVRCSQSQGTAGELREVPEKALAGLWRWRPVVLRPAEIPLGQAGSPGHHDDLSQETKRRPVS